MSRSLKVLIVEDRPADAELMVHELRRAGFDPDWHRVETESDCISELKTTPDVILADHTLPQFGAPRVLEILAEQRLDIPCIVVTGSISEETAVERLKEGAADYILKDRMGRLGQAVIRALEEKSVKDRRRQAEEKLAARNRELETLHQIGQSLLNNLDLKKVAEETLEKTVALGGFDVGTIELVDFEAHTLQAIAWRGFRSAKALPGGQPANRVDPEAGRAVRRLRTLGELRPRVDEDLTQGEHMRRFKNDGVRTAVTIPIVVEDKAIGMFRLGYRSVREVAAEGLNLFQAIANQTGIAIQKIRLYEETQKNLEHIRALREIDVAITSTLDLHALLNILLDKINLLLPNSATVVRLINRETGELECVASRNIDVEAYGSQRRIANFAFTSKAIQGRSPIFIPNVRTDPRIADPEFFREQGIVSYLIVPLIAKEEVVGVLSFFSKGEREFSDDEVEFAQTLAGQGAIAIHNAQLYEQLVKSNNVKDDFLSVMSHELRTPLNVVMGYTAMIKDGLLGDVNPQQEAALQRVIDQANDQLAMINNVLYATVIEFQKPGVDSQEMSPAEFLDQLRSDYGARLQPEGLTIQWEYSRDLPLIRTDGAKLRLVLQNLIGNAIKFTGKGEVTVSAAISRNGRSDQWMEFKVADTGVGISKKQLPLIFQKFHQVDSSQTRTFGGVGMGLYVVKRFTELLGGTVGVESEPGTGSIFTVRIPIGNSFS